MNEQSHTLRLRRSAKSLACYYAALGVLLVVAGGYQALETRDIFRGLRHPETNYQAPFVVDPATATIEDARQAEDWGVHKGDLLVALDGQPYTGTHVLDDALDHRRPNPTLIVTVRTPAGNGSSVARTFQIPLRTLQEEGHETKPLIVARIILYVVMPLFCVILGFGVALVRPRDPLAWLLLGLMLGFGQFIGFSTGAWGPVIRDLASAYHLLASNLWPIVMLLFGLYFPEPFPNGRLEGYRALWEASVDRLQRYLEPPPFWEKLKWALVIPLGLGALVDTVIKTAAVENYAAVERLARVWAPFDKVEWVLSFVAVGGFFVSVFAKGSMAVSRDAKRRLRLLYCGSSISLTPIFIAVLISLMKGEDFGKFLPEWLFFTILLLLFLFPLTLAYTIVVQRAMDVRVVVRQGMQYALARGGVRVVRGALSVGLIWASVYLLQHSNARSPAFYAIIAASALVGLSFRRLGDGLRNWTDHRFFRDAYNAEQILSELGDKVRTIVETQPLLATVSHRIAESLHVSRVAALIDGSGPYRPAYALGYPEPPRVIFSADAATVRELAEAGQPTRVYPDDPDSWLYRRPDVGEQERRQLAELGAELLLPLAVRDHLLGFISLGQKRSEAPYTSSDLRLLNSVAVQTGLALENSRLAATVAREVAQREKLNRELEIAREVQQRLFPQKLPPVSGLDYSGACRPALGVGGDYYDFLALPEGRLGIAVGDVSGKGIAAALMMATLQASLRGEAIRGWGRGSGDLGQMISGVNRLVFEASTSNRYATFFYAEYDPERLVLNYVNAGHNPPMLFRKRPKDWQVLRLEAGGTVIGLLEHFPFEQASLSLASGDELVIYTDGVSEAMNLADEEWGETRMMEMIERCQGLSAAQTIEFLMAGADAFASGAPQHDDMTLVILRVLPGAP